MSKVKICLGILVWIMLGFLVAEIGLAIGFFTAMIFMHIPFWKILLLTLLGMAAVGLHLLSEESNK